jgi:hypothetical protein
VEVAFSDLPNTIPASTEVRAVDGLGQFKVLTLDYPNGMRGSGGARGTAIARVESEAGDRALELSYVSPEMMWSAAYTATLPAGRAEATLVGYAHIVNRSGRAFPGATIHLVSSVSSNFSVAVTDGSPLPRSFAPLARVGEMPLDLPQPIFEVQALDLEPATVRDGYDKIVEFMRVPGVSIEVERVVEFGQSHGRGRRSDCAAVSILAVFRNNASNGLGVTLPGGTFRLFTVQADGQRALVGTGQVDETRPGDAARVRVGSEKDLTATRMLVAYDGDRRTKKCEMTYRIVLKSAKDHIVTVNVRDAASEKLLRTTYDPTKVSATDTAFTVVVPPRSTAEVEYTALYNCE